MSANRLPPMHLGCLIHWNKVLEILQIEAQTTLLPCTLNCPICQDGSFTIYHDNTYRGEWCFCSGCKWTGDMVELTAKIVNLPIEDTIKMLAAHHPQLYDYALDVAIARYKEYVLDFRAKANAFWEKASAQFLTAQSARSLRLDLEVVYDPPPKVWQKRGGQFVGFATKQQLEEFYDYVGPFSMSRAFTEKVAKTAKEFMIIPFWDLPGRIGALAWAVIPDRGTTSVKIYSAAQHPEGGSWTHRREYKQPGVAMLDAITAQDGPVFVFLDPLLALRTHIKHLASNDNVLPVASVYCESAATPVLRWQAPLNPMVFFAEHTTADLFRHAMAAKGRITFNHAHIEDVIMFQRRMQPEAWLDKLAEASRPWEQALEEHIASVSTTEVEQLVRGLAWTHQEMADYRDGCIPSVKAKLDVVLKSAYQFRQTDLGGRLIAETDKGWQLVKTGEIICDAVIHIEKIIHDTNSDKVYYQGQIGYKGEFIQFTAGAEEFEKNAFKWVDKFLISQGKGYLTYNNAFMRHVVNISKRFHKPDSVIGLSNYGWDERTARFVLPNYTIEMGGNVSTVDTPRPCLQVPPAQNLPQPSILSTTEAALISEWKPDVQLAWAILAGIAYNILSKPFGYQSLGILLSKDSGRTAQELAMLMGCPRIHVLQTTRKAMAVIEALHKEEKAATWPLIVLTSAGTSRPAHNWLETGEHNCFVEVNWYCSRVLSIKGGWLRVDGKCTAIRPELRILAPKLLPTFIAYLASKHLHREQIASNHLENLTNDLMAWAETVGADPLTVKHSINERLWQEYEGSEADSFWELLTRLTVEGHLPHYAQSYNKIADSPIILQLDEFDGSVWLSKRRLNNIMAGRKVYLPVLDFVRISQALTDSGELLDEYVYKGDPGWLFKKETWDLRLAVNAAKQRNNKKVI